MSPPASRWTAIEPLFTRALDLAPADRDEFLSTACPADQALRSEVQRLLAAHDAIIAEGGTGDRFLEQLDAECAAALVESTLGRTLREALGARYAVERQLGSGGMAEVFAARDLRHDRMVAIKIVRQDVATSQLEERFEREVRIAARLQHPHIVPLYDSGIAGGLRYYVMPLVDGPTLRKRLEESQRLLLDEVLRIVEEVAGALDCAHASGIVHRDIKPENILLSGGHALVADFGVARPVADASVSSILTGVGMAVGTPAYMSPEQAGGERILDGRSDQYALACVAYELLTGRPPFRGETAQALIAQHFVAPVPSLGLEPAMVSRALDNVMARALAKEPAARFVTTLEFASALRAASMRTHDIDPMAASFGAPSLGNVPSAASPLIGREGTLADAIALICRPDVQLVTFTGTGGTGKTRLALEVGAWLGRSFEGGAWFVPLAHLTDPSLVPSAVGHVLGLHDQGSASLLDALAGLVGGRRLLLVVDNFEHVVGATPWLCELLPRVPTLKVLVTSRAVLRARGEHEFPVPPLEVPDLSSANAQDLAAYPAIQLFAERARAVEPSFTITKDNGAAVAEICVRLDGLPLAIELAAARINLLTPHAILDRLGHRLRLLTRGARDQPERHQTLRQAIAWSYNLLGDAERRLFARLGVFAGGCTVETAEIVCDPAGSLGIDVLDGIDALLDASLLQRDGRNGTQASPRIRMLETIREYALEIFASDAQADEVRDRHRDWFLGLARRAAPELTGPHLDRWFATLTSEHANLRAALDRSVQLGDAETALGFGAALWRYWLVRGHLREGREALDRVLALPAANRLDTLRADTLTGAGTLASTLCEPDVALSCLSRALELRRGLGDSAGVARALADLGWAAMKRSDFSEAERLSNEALELSRTLGDKRLTALSLSNLGWVALNQGDFSAARDLFEQGLKLRRELADERGAAYMLLCLEWTASRSGDYARALSLAEEILPTFRAIGDVRLYAAALSALARASLALGDARRARSVLEAEVLPIMRQTGDRWNVAVALCQLSSVMREQGDLARAEALATESVEIHRAIRDRQGLGESLGALALVARSRGDEARAQALFKESLEVRRAVGDRAGIAECERALEASGIVADVS